MNESELLPRKKCQELFLAVEQAARRAGITEVEISLASTADSLTRFANNEIHQNVSERATALSVRAIVDGRTARASTNRLHRDGIQATVDEAIALARASEPARTAAACTRIRLSAMVSTTRKRPRRARRRSARAGVADAIRVVESARTDRRRHLLDCAERRSR